METIRTKAVKRVMGSNTTYFFVDNKNFYVKCENKESREKFEKYLKENLPQYTLWKEGTGNMNWVLYRNDMFEDCGYYLHFKGGNEIELPINCSSCHSMFFECVLSKGFSLGDKFDTSNVICMKNMFSRCVLVEGFSLGEKFDTSNVTDMHEMFSGCTFPKWLSLGDKFDTSNVINMNSMFAGCKFPEGFSLGDKFDTSNVTNMGVMFWYCVLPEGFSFGDKFVISSNANTAGMFDYCKLSKGFQYPKGYEELVNQATGF